MFFEGGRPVPVYTLANAALEIVGAIASQTGIRTTVQDVAEMFYARGVTGKALAVSTGNSTNGVCGLRCLKVRQRSQCPMAKPS